VKITQIVRKVTGSNYSNIELTATVSEDDNVIDCAVELDKKCEEVLDKISKEKQEELEKKSKSREMLDRVEILKRLVEENKVDYLPF